MSKVKIYKGHVEQIELARANLKTAEDKLNDWVAVKFYSVLQQVRVVTEKANRGQSDGEELLPEGAKWASHRAANITITSFDGDFIHFSYTYSHHIKGREAHTGALAASDLSLSTWDLSKKTRAALNIARDERRVRSDKAVQLQRDLQELRREEAELKKSLDRQMRKIRNSISTREASLKAL